MNPLSSQVMFEQVSLSIRYLLPELTLVGSACVLFLLAAFRSSRRFSGCFAFGVILAAASIALLVEEPAFLARDRFIAPIDPSGLAPFIRWLALGAGALYVLLGFSDSSRQTAPEYFGCLLVVLGGLSLVARANDLLSLFLALEMISIPTYVLLYLPTKSKAGQEAALKYFMLSILSSAILLFGFSYLYGLSGTLNLPLIAETLSKASRVGPISPMALVAVVLVIAGLGFRIAAVPFHFYAPDVYEGAPNGVVAQLAFIPKVAGLVALARVMGLLMPDAPFDAARTLIPLTLWVIAAVTMSFGNLLALIQDNLKRLFAYSGIAHAGYMLIGVLVAMESGVGTQSGFDSVLVYLVAYGLMTVGIFCVLGYLTHSGRTIETVDDLAGLGRTNPVAAGMMCVFFLSLIGMPLTAGFNGKLLLFFGAFETPTTTPLKDLYRILTLIAVLNSAVAAVYYLKILGVMFLRSPLQPAEPARGYAAFLAAFICAVGTLAVGVYPKPLVEAARKAAPIPTAAATAQPKSTAGLAP